MTKMFVSHLSNSQAVEFPKFFCNDDLIFKRSYQEYKYNITKINSRNGFETLNQILLAGNLL